MNILIVDDEFYIVKGLLQNVNWQKFGINQTFPAYSAKQAKDILLSDTPVDIVLTDIEMPRETGLDLAIWMQEHDFHPVTIILTGHQRFDYAKQALDLHIFSYLLKPVDYDDLDLKMQAAVKEVKARKKAEAAETVSSVEEDDSDSFIDLVKKYIRSHIGNPDLSRNLIADEIHMNPDYVSHLFHKKAGVSLSNYISEERIRYAKKLLATTNLSLQQISDKTGFSGISYFHRQFKKVTGVTPQQYKDAHRKEETPSS